MYKNIAPILKSSIDVKAESFLENKDMMLEKINELQNLLDEVELGGGQHHLDRLAAKGKLPVRERIKNLLDNDTPFLEISPFAAWGTSFTVGGGCVAGIGLVAGKECVIFANDPSVLGGAMTVYVWEKWMRCIQIARENRIPFINLVESAGADLRGMQPDSGENKARQLVFPHFAESGRSFYEMTELSKLKIPVVSIVFGSSTAGGAYQPGMSDYNIFIKQQSKAFLAGPPLVQMATGEISDDETLGGAEMHSKISGFSDFLAEDELDALRMCRNVVAHLNIYKKSSFSISAFKGPKYDPNDLLGLFSEDLKSPVDIREVIMRVVDESRFEEFKPLYGSTMVCGWSNVFGYRLELLGITGQYIQSLLRNLLLLYSYVINQIYL